MSKLTDMLNKYRNAKSVAVRVGIMDQATYPDGTSVAMVGYVNEYGYEGTVPARTHTIYHSTDKEGNITNSGKFVKANKANLARVVTIPEHKVSVPSRPFFRTAIENERSELKKMAASLFQKHDVETALKLVGEHMVGALGRSVMTWSDPPNAKSTIDAKGYNAPLRANDKLLRKSFTVELESDD